MKSVWIILFIIVTALVFSAWMYLKDARTAPAQQSKRTPFRMPPPDPNVLMIRGCDFYVRLIPEKKNEMLAAIRKAIGNEGTVYDQGSHAVVLWHDFQPPDAVLEQLSRDFQTEVIWLVFQKQVDAFGYQRWLSGTRLRRLTFGCYEKERTWEEVDGTPEPWEAAAIFDERELENRIRRDKKYNAITDAEEQRLRAIWREHRLEVNSEEPNIAGRDVAEAVAIAYGLPGWD